MLEIALPLAMLGLLVAGVVAARSNVIGASVTAAGFGISGALLQFVAVRGWDVSWRVAQVWLLGTLIAIFAVSLLVGRRRMPVEHARSWPWILSGGAALVFLASRALAPLDPAPLSSVGYLVTRIAAEDNAKWVNASARLIGDAPVDTWANVGGPLVLVLTLAGSIIAGISQLLYGGVNEVAVAAGAPVMAEHMLVIAAPFALTPLLVGRFLIRGGKRSVPVSVFVVMAILLMAINTVLLAIGHLTFQYAILILTLWLATFIRSVQGVPLRTLSSLAVVTLAMVWFPLAPISVAVIASGFVVGVYFLLQRDARRRLGVALLGLFGVAAVLLVEFLFSSISWSLGLTASSASHTGGGFGVSALTLPTFPLFSDPGGSEELTPTLIALCTFGVLGALFAFSSSGMSARGILIRFAPIGLLATFAGTVAILDFWAVGDGPGYGSLKVAFGTLIPILLVTVPLAILAVTSSDSNGRVMRFGILGVIVVLLSLDTLIPRAVLQTKPSLWPSTASSPYWAPAEVRPTGEQPLDRNPIGCVFAPPGAEVPSALPSGQLAYACSRMLSGVAGMGREAAVIVDWELTEWRQNRSLWDEYYVYFTQLPESTRSRTLILMNEDQQVVGLDSLEGLLNRFPPKESR